MRLAWFTGTPPESRHPLDHPARLLDVLGNVHEIDVIAGSTAHEFVWKHVRTPYDVCVYEIGRTADEFIWPYVLHYPGILLLDHPSVRDRRALPASRLVVVSDPAVAAALEATFSPARLRVAPTGATGPGDGPGERDRGTGPLVVGVVGGQRLDVVARAAARAREAGAAVELAAHAGPQDVLRDADVIAALEWPPGAGPPSAALLAMAAGTPAIVLEVEATAGWPALDPQTWRPRGFDAAAPIAVSLDPRDEEHSLMRALVRLAADAPLRAALGAAGHSWWRSHGTLDHAAGAWEALLAEAASLGPAAPQPVQDGSADARAVLQELGVRVEFL